MESNKEDAEKCIRIAQKAISDGDQPKAVKFLKRSLRLYPSTKAEELLDEVEKKAHFTDNSSGDQKAKESMPDLSELHGSAQPEKPSYTSAQQELAQRINQCKDYYAILGVEKEASETEIKKGYRKMALQLHPDKNLAPGSTEAFKAVGKAFAVLSDSEKRERYDRYGPEGVDEGLRRRRRHSSSSSEYEEEAFDPEELFNMFFGGRGFPGENVRVFRQGNTYYYDRRPTRRQRTGHHNQESEFAAWMRFLPFVALFLFTFLGRLFTPSPVYSLSSKGDFRRPQHTANLDVMYYTKSDFDTEYKKGSVDRRRVEEEVEAVYIENLRHACYQEQINKENLRNKGIYFGRSDYVERAMKMTTPSCDKYQKLYGKVR